MSIILKLPWVSSHMSITEIKSLSFYIFYHWNLNISCESYEAQSNYSLLCQHCSLIFSHWSLIFLSVHPITHTYMWMSFCGARFWLDTRMCFYAARSIDPKDMICNDYIYVVPMWTLESNVINVFIQSSHPHSKTICFPLYPPGHSLGKDNQYGYINFYFPSYGIKRYIQSRILILHIFTYFMYEHACLANHIHTTIYKDSRS